MNLKEPPLSSAIEDKIARAVSCCEDFKAQFLKDRTTVDLLAGLENAIQASHHEMQKAAIAALCRECDQKEGGSCCGAGLESRYDAWLLLINLLLGGELPSKRHDRKSCFFLGEHGCLLKARHVICVNYLCKKITDQVDPCKIQGLREKEGIELEILFRMHERIKKTTREWTKS